MVEIRWHSQTKGRVNSEHKHQPTPARQSSTLPGRAWGCNSSALLTYLRAYTNGTESRESLKIYFRFYNERCLHETLNYATPDEVYFGQLAATTPAAA
jgi:hypothetical protein